MEREWLDRYQVERERHHTRERENKKALSRLNEDLKNEQTKLNQEIGKAQRVKKSNQEMRVKMSELVIKNSQLKK